MEYINTKMDNTQTYKYNQEEFYNASGRVDTRQFKGNVYYSEAKRIMDSIQKEYDISKASWREAKGSLRTGSIIQRAYKKADDWMRLIQMDYDTARNVFSTVEYQKGKLEKATRNLDANTAKGNLLRAKNTLSKKYQEIHLKRNRLDGERTLIGKAVQETHKYNPAIIPIRNAFLFLVQMNVFAFATNMNTMIENAKKGDTKAQAGTHHLQRTYEGFGGSWKALNNNINRGKNKKPIFNKDVREDPFRLLRENKSGFDGEEPRSNFIISGSTITAIATAIAEATPLSVTVAEILLYAVGSVASGAGSALVKSLMKDATPEQEDMINKMDSTITPEDALLYQEQQRKEKQRKTAIILGGVLGGLVVAGFVTYAIIKTVKKK